MARSSNNSEVQSIFKLNSMEKEKRKRNLVIFNLPELESVLRAEQISADTASIKDIFTKINLPVDTWNVWDTFSKIRSYEYNTGETGLMIRYVLDASSVVQASNRSGN
ncbi:hypothetical protein Trydic_g19982 [Trypoxylus dichotomus]